MINTITKRALNKLAHRVTDCIPMPTEHGTDAMVNALLNACGKISELNIELKPSIELNWRLQESIHSHTLVIQKVVESEVTLLL